MKHLLKSHLASLQKSGGFSLIEILIALTLMGIVGTFVTINVLDKLDEGKIQTAQMQMTSFSAALKEYKRKCGIYPTGEQGLDALLQKPTGGKDCKNYPPNGFLMEEAIEIPPDPWDESYYYESDGRKYQIYSYGKDTVEGGEEADADLYYPPRKK